jgi:hypothetical protein
MQCDEIKEIKNFLKIMKEKLSSFNDDVDYDYSQKVFCV